MKKNLTGSTLPVSLFTELALVANNIGWGRLCFWLALAVVLFSGTVSNAAVTITRTSGTNTFYIDTSKTPFLNSAYVSYLIQNNDAVTYSNVWVRIDSFAGGIIGLAANEDGEVNLGTLAPGETRPAFFYLTASGAAALQQSHAIKVYDGYPAYGGTLLANQTFSLRSVSETIAANANKVSTIVYGPEPPTLGGIVTIVVEGNTGTIGSGKQLSFTAASYADWRADAYELINTVVELSGANTGSFTNTLFLPLETVTNTADTAYVATYKLRAVGVTMAPTQVSPVGYISSGTQVKHTTTGNFGGMSPIQPATNAVSLAMFADTNQLFAAGTITFTLRVSNPGEYDAFLDRFENTLPSGAAYVGNSSSFNGAGFGNPYVSGQLLAWAGYFEIPAGATRDFIFQATFPVTTGRYTNSAVAFTQFAQIDTTLDTTDNAPATQVIRVFGPNVAPVANDDSAATLEDDAVTVDVLANDEDENIDPSSVDLDPTTAGQQTSVTTVQGTWTVDVDGLVTFTPANNFSGTATLSYTVTDTAGVVSGSATISITVDSANDAPTLDAISNVTINEDAPLQVVSLTGISGGEAGQSLSVTSSSNTGLVPNPTVSYTSPDATGSISFTPVADAFGTATLSVVVTDNGGTANGGVDAVTNTFVVTVNPVNDVPSFTKGNDIRVNRGATNVLTFVKWATAISEGPANETNQLVSFIVTTTNSAFFASGGEPTINSLGDLTFQLSGTVGTNTISVRIQDDGGTANGGVDTSAIQTFVIAVSSAGLIPATGGEAISATNAANANPPGEWTTLTGPKYIEGASTNVTEGTIILHAPAGFEFDTFTNVNPPRAIVNIVGGGSSPASQTINMLPEGGAIEMDSVTASTMTLTITRSSRRLNVNQHAFCSLTWTNIRVRPITGSPLVSGFITNSGTSSQISVSAGITSWGTLGMVAGPAAGLQIIQQPSSTATAGSPFAEQPIIRIVDAAGNWLFNNNTSQVTVARLNGSGTLQGTTTLTAVNGEVNFTNLNHLVAGTINLQFTSAGLPSVNSTDVTISAAAASQLVISTQPSATATAGVAFAQQPVIRIEDAFGNLVDSTAAVTVARNSGAGTLQGTTTVNAVGGIVTFSGLNHLVAGTIDLLFTSPGLNSATSSNIVISAGPAAKLTIATQPSNTATAGIDFAQQPVIRIEDQYGNLVTTDNTTQITVARNYGDGTLQGTTTMTAVGGIVSFTDLDHRVAGTINLIFTSSTGLTPATSSNITISAGAPAALAIDAQPSGRATVNVPFPDQPVVMIVDAYGNVCAGDNTTQVTVARNAGSGTLQGTTTLTASGGFVAYSDLYHPVNGTINLQFTSTGLASVISQNIVLTPAISNIAFVTQPQDAVISQSIGSVTVRLENGGVPVAAAGVPITIELASGTGLLGGTLTLLTDASGQVTFTDLNIDDYGVKVLEARSELLTASSDSFTIMGNPPTLTAMNTLSGGTEDTSITITYATLIDAGDEADAEGDTISFLIDEVTSGTLTVNGVPVVPGVTLIGPGDELVWTPDANSNGSAVSAFTVKAHDGTSASATAVTVSVDVAAVNDAPTLTTINTLTGGFEDVPYTITYASLINEGDEADVDGDTVLFRIETLGDGTLTKDGVPVVPGVTTLGPGEELVWTPASNDNGTLEAFTVKAYDGSLASASEVPVQVEITAENDVPTLTTINTLNGAVEDTAFTVTYAMLAAAADEADEDGDSLGFQVEGVTSGTLTKNGVAVTPGSTLLNTGEEFVWTPAADEYGNALNAFTVRAFDGTAPSALPATQVTVNVAPVNDVPSYVKGIDPVVNNKDAGLRTYAGWAASVSTGPANEAAQTVTFIVSNDNNSIFAVQPSIDSAGTLTFTPNGTLGSATVTVQIQDNGGTSNGGDDTSDAQTFVVTLAEGTLIIATGGEAISADTAANAASPAWTILTGPSYEENAPGDIGAGTFVINAPAGFEFNTAETVRVQISTRNAFDVPASNINNAASGTEVDATVTASQITFTITEASEASVTNKLTWLNIQVRPISGSPLVSGSLTKTGTSVTYQVADGSTSLGELGSVAGSATSIEIVQQPSATATAGDDFGQQPIVRVVDQFGNVVTSDNTTEITVVRQDGSGTLQGTTTVTVVNGVATFTDLSHTVAGTISLGFSAPGLTPAESNDVVITPAAASGLVISTEPSTTATAGDAFAQQPVVRVVDAFGNTVTGDNTTQITVARNNGSGTLQGTTTLTVSGGVAAFGDLYHTVAGTIDLVFSSNTALPSVISGDIEVSAGAAAAMQIATQPSPVATAGVNFVQQPIVQIVDAFGNVITGDNTTQITVARNDGSGTLQGTTTVTVAAGAGTFTDLFHTVAGTIDLAFSSSTGLPIVTSDDIVVSAAAPSRLTIQTQPSDTATAGVNFAQQPVIRIEDEFGNVITSDNTTEVTVAVFSGDGTLQGTVTGTAVNGIITFTDLHHLVTGDITLRFTSPGLTPATSEVITITAGPAAGLAIDTQPSPTATAGITFAQQPVVRIVDAYGNTVTSDNTTQIIVARDSGSGTLQGTTTLTVSGGVATFADLFHTVAGTIDLVFTSSTGLPSVTSEDIVISPAAASKLEIAVQPSPTATAGEDFVQQPVVRVVDEFGNLVDLDNTTQITVARNDGSGTLQGTTTITVTGGIATFTDLHHTVADTIDLTFTSPSLTSVTSNDVVITAGPATGLAIVTQPSAAATAGTAFGQQPAVRIVDAFGNTVTSDDTTQITVARNDGTGTLQGTTTVTVINGVATFTDLNHTVAGTIDLIFTSTPNVGTIVSDDIVISAGAAVGLALSTQPSPTATAGIDFVQQPVVRVVDAYGNTVTTDNATQITVARNDGAGTLQGTTTVTVTGGVATFTDLYHTVAGTIDLVFTSNPDVGSVVSDDIVVSAAAASSLAIVAQPSSAATAGVAFTQQPAVRVVDAYGNTVTTDNTTQITVARNDGTGTLQGTTTVTVIGGVATFTDLQHTVTGTIDLVFTSNPDVGSVVSDDIVVTSGAGVGLVIVSQPSAAATAGVAFAQQPVVRIVDAYGNTVTGDDTTQVTVARNDGSGTLQGTTTVTVANGVATFSDLYHTVAGTIDLIFTTDPNVGSTVSDDILISPASAAGLAITTQPSATATAGVAFVQQPVVRVVDAFGNTVTGDNTTQISVARNDGSGTLQGTTTVTVSGGTASFSDLYHTVAGTIDLVFSSSPNVGSVTSDDIIISAATASGLAIATQPSPTATAGTAFPQQPVVHVVDAFGNIVISDNTTEVSVARNDGTGTLQGTTTLTVNGGVASFTDLYHTVVGTIDLIFTSNPDVGSVTSDDIIITPPAVASRLGIQTQPSPTALEGALFGTQPVIRIEDDFGNLIAGDNTTQVTVDIVAGDGTLLGTRTVTAVNGLATFTDLSYTMSGNITLVFTSSPVLVPVTSDLIAVTGINDAPVFTLTTTDVQTLEDSGPQSFQLGNVINAGPIDESWQELTITLTNDNAALFLVQPQVSSAGVLTYTLNPDVSGLANVVITVVDNGGTANGGVDTTVVNFAITALPVNDQPTFFKSADIFLPTTIRTSNVPEFAMAIIPGPEDELTQNTTFTVTNDSAWAFITQPTITPDGRLTFEVDSTVSNLVATVTVVLIDDGGTANGGVDTSLPQTFRIALSSYYNYPRGNTFTNYAGPSGMWLGNLRGTSQWRDIITANSSNDTVTVRLWAGASVFTAPTNYPVGRQPVAVRSGNLNGDASEDVVTANFGTNTVSVLMNVGGGRLGIARDEIVGTTPNPGPSAVTIADANGDGSQDVLVANFNENTVTVLFGTGDGYFAAVSHFAVGAGPSSILATDMDKDGYIDILTANRTAGTLTILKGQGNGAFIAQTVTMFSGGDPQPVYALPADFNGDNIVDIATANYNSNTVSILIGQADGSYVVGTNYVVGQNPRSLLVRDLNHDLIRDIVVVNSGDATLRVLLCNGDGTFEYGDVLATGSNPIVVVGSNFNDDLTTDFVVSNYGDGTLSLFRYTGPVTFNQWIDINEDVPKTFTFSGRVTSYLGSTTNYVILTQPTNGAVVLSGIGPNVTYTPDRDYFGEDCFSYRAEYRIGDVLLQSGVSRVYLTVKSLNDRPSFTLSQAVITVPEESALVTIPNFATDLSAGPANESEQSLLFTVTSSSATAFKVKPSITTDGSLSFQPTLNFVGTVTVSVRLKDDGQIGVGHTNISDVSTFQIVVTPLLVKQLKGVYNGLFYETNGIAHHSSGYFTFNMAPTRIFKGKLMLDGQTLLFSNQFNAAGESAITINRISKPAVTLQLALDMVSSSDQVTGTVSSSGWTAELLGDRQVFNARTNIAPFTGKYTLVLPGTFSNASLPAGDGYGVLTVNGAGALKFSGAMGDGIAAAQGSAVSKNGYWPLYVPRYSGKGSILGWILFTNRSTSSLEGDVNWIRPRTTSKLYTAGFTNEVGLVGSTYVPPVGAVPILNLTNATISFNGGNLLRGLTNSVSLSSSNLFTVSGTNGVTLNINLLNGFVSGSFTNPVTRKKVTLRSVGLQQQDSVRGLFLGTNQSGAVLIQNQGQQ